MASDLLELTADIVIAHASMTEMSSDGLLKEIKMVYATLEGLAKGKIEISAQEPKKQGRKAQGTVAAIAEEKPVIPPAPALTIEEAFKPDQVACMICGKKGMTTLKRHIATAHDLKPGQYRKQFNVPKDQPLAATEYVAKRRQMALDRGLGEKLAAAREAKKARQMGE
ncbi:MAG: MucR family transcriptional regulator [Proteobacteria bacterium]|nr:MucR family transcriptional regulator [Pseudomonadota bacterium]MBU2227251.1 MucR family transcriptional regulator [Pseudomonadota bacterium]